MWKGEGWQEAVDSDGKLTFRSKVVEQSLEVKVPIVQDEISTEKKRGRPKKYNHENIPVKIHLTWSAKRAEKDRSDRERMLERLRKRLDKPYQLKAAIKRGCTL
ncbi:hypothetical protein [Desulfosporosinus shakirovi]|uniref:hypothetical protein n=1 Tax=Desulfosporosinus shakirovi TaxID=2885154 RepID=UPI001E375968|nr:hypothetical protein [Desulfosporosinus sp. SRJS8]MCB8818331.1 hypothetical protein [Desulfosporosinus sp. SRJS8]